MSRSLPRKVNESSVIPQVAVIAKTLNAVIEFAASLQIAESPNTRIERTSNRTTVHVKKSSGSTTDDGSPRWL